ncbi:MAG: hypothetical protein AB1630_05805 [bacterium]
MNDQNQYYENYPATIIILRNIFEIVIWGIGVLLLVKFGKWVVISYLIYSALMVAWIMRFRCKYCYYYGKTCTIGYGKVASMFFDRGDNEEFPKKIKYIIPAILTWILPVIGGVFLLIRNFSVIILILVVVFIVFRFVLSERVLVKYGCQFCYQNHDCPAYQLKHGHKK